MGATDQEGSKWWGGVVFKIAITTINIYGVSCVKVGCILNKCKRAPGGEIYLSQGFILSFYNKSDQNENNL